MTGSKYIQDHMPGNVCFGCGINNPQGLQIKSFREGDEVVAVWHSIEKYHGWEKVINGGILATLIDCHSMATALDSAYRAEGRELGSLPVYRYATGTITVRYLKPTPNDRPIELRARTTNLSGRKARVECKVLVDGEKTAEAEVVGIRVFEGEAEDKSMFT